MATEQDDFAAAFKATTEDIISGKTGADVVTTVAPAPEPVAVVAPAEVAATPTTPAEPVAPASAEAAAAVVAPAVVEPAAPVADPAATPAAVADPAAPAAVPAVVDPAAAPVVAPAAPVAVSPPVDPAKDPALLAEIERLKTELAAKAVAAPVAPPAQVVEPVVEKPKPYEFSAEQQTAIDEFKKEWPDIAKAFDAREAAIIGNLTSQFETQLKTTMAEFAKQVQLGLDPVVSAHLQSEEQRHFAQITAAHSDFYEVAKLVPEWIGKQKPVAKKVYEEIWKDGSAQEVVELLADFKVGTGRVQPQTQNVPSATPIKPVPAAPVAPDPAKVAALTVVEGGQRTNVRTEQPAPDDFAAAFNKTVVELTAVAAK